MESNGQGAFSPGRIQLYEVDEETGKKGATGSRDTGADHTQSGAAVSRTAAPFCSSIRFAFLRCERPGVVSPYWTVAEIPVNPFGAKGPLFPRRPPGPPMPPLPML